MPSKAASAPSDPSPMNSPHAQDIQGPPAEDSAGLGVLLDPEPAEQVNSLSELLALRERVLEKRALIGIDRRNCIEQRVHNAHAQTKFFELFSAHMSSDQVPDQQREPLNPSMRAAWEQVQRAAFRLSHLEEHIQTLERTLTVLERRLQAKENTVYEEMKKIYGMATEASSSDGPEAESLDGTLSVGTAASSQTHPLEREYYDRIGDVNIFRERLLNFESEHQRLRIMRDNQEAHSDQPLEPEDEFNEKYVETRSSLIQEYIMAKRDVQKLKEQCKGLQLDIEEPNFPAEVEGDSLDRMLRFTREISQSVAASGSNAGLLRRSLDSPDARRLQLHNDEPKDRLHNWLIDIWKVNTHGEVEDNMVHYRSAQENRPKLLAVPSPAYKTAPGSYLNLDGPSIDASKWTEGEAEAAVPFPNYNLLSSHSRAPSVDKEKDLPKSMWQGDAPRRRYSDPAEDVARIVHEDILSPAKITD